MTVVGMQLGDGECRVVFNALLSSSRGQQRRPITVAVTVIKEALTSGDFVVSRRRFFANILCTLLAYTRIAPLRSSESRSCRMRQRYEASAGP